jgi:hypothetical protein
MHALKGYQSGGAGGAAIGFGLLAVAEAIRYAADKYAQQPRVVTNSYETTPAGDKELR